MKKNAIVQIGVPILLGLTCTILEFFLSSICRRNTGIILMCFGLSAAFTTGLLAIYKRYTVCGWFAVSSCGGMMILIAYVLTFPYMYINTSSVFIIAANWLTVIGVCVLVRFIKRNDDPADFNTFFRLSSIVFAVFYIAVLGYALFFQQSAARREIWGLNLIPGATIMAYMKGGNNTIQAIINLAANILLFTPLGFYLPVYAPGMKWVYRVIILFFIPVAVESIQFLSARGITDIDDVLLNFAGGLMGLGILYFMEALFQKRRHDRSTKLFVLIGE